tara:strand:- start:722 stop:1162 length:441 start_codon:yes stop_codon:yes gene_type:complete
MKNISANNKITLHSTLVAAGTGLITPASGVDMANFETCLFIVSFGAIVSGAATSIEVHQSADDSSYAALLGSNVTVVDTADDTIVYIEVNKPIDQYLKCLVNRATQNATVNSIVALQGGPRVAPVTHDSSTVTTGEFHVSPAEGTA